MVTPQRGERTTILYLLTDELSSVLVRGQLGYLADHGFDVTVATRRAEPDVAPEPGKWDDGVTVEHVPFVREPAPFADLRGLWATIHLIRRVRPTIVHASTPKAGLLGMVAARMCRVPVRLYVVRGFRFETATRWWRRLFVALEWLAARCATHVIFNSRSLMAVAESEGVIRPGRGRVLGNGIDLARFADDRLPTPVEARAQFGLPIDAHVVGFVGRFTKDKGIEDLIRAFRSFGTAGEGAWLLLVGQFEDGDALASSVRSTIESNPQIVVVPWIDNPDAAYRAMDVLAFPSFREGLPNVPLEAQLCERPVVAYAATGTVDAVADGIGGVLVPVGDVAGFEAALRALLDDGERRDHLGRAGRAWVAERFDRDRVWALLLELLQQCSPPERRR